MDLVKIRLCELYWIGLAQDRAKWRVVDSVMNFRVELARGYTTGGFSSVLSSTELVQLITYLLHGP
jgi:hypothetical protein